MADINSLAADVATLKTAVDTLLASGTPGQLTPAQQATVDSTDAEVTALTQQVTAATPPPA